jgi:hypothetical protein
VLPEGALHPDLVERLADEAAKAAGHLLTICVRALDYCPPVDLTFGDYLRALITADLQVVPQDRLGYRIAIVEAFRARGIYPKGLRSLAVDNVVWDRPSAEVRALLRKRPLVLRPYANEYAYLDNRDAADPRRDIFEHLSKWRGELHAAVQRLLGSLDAAQRDVLAEDMGLDLRPGHAAFEVRSLQFTRKASPAGPGVPQGLLSIVQARAAPGAGSFLFRGGCTIVVDLRSGDIDYVIRKNVRSDARLEAERAFRVDARAGLAGTYFGALNETDPSRLLAQLHGFNPETDHG